MLMNSSSKERLNSFFIVILIICSINFFEFQKFKGSFVKYLQFGYLLLAICLSIPYLFAKKGAFTIPVRCIFISVLISVFIATFTRDQTFIDSLGGSIPVLIWGVFFYLAHLKYPVKKIENIVVGYCLLYLLLYFFQFTHPDTPYFIKPETIDYSRGILRIVFPGRGIFYLAIFIAITKVTTTKYKLWFWVTLSILGIVVTAMQVTRQFIFAAIIIYLIHFLKELNWYKKAIILGAFFSIAIYIYNSNSLIVKNLRDTQEQENDLGADYIRVQESIFYLTEFSNTPFNRVFGNGVPYGERSGYNKYYGQILMAYGYWLSDVGLFAVYAMFGVFAIWGYMMIWIKSFTLKLSKKYYYLKYYLWFLLITCLTSDTIYSSYDLIATVLVIYMYQSVYEKEKLNQILPLHKINTNLNINSLTALQ